MLKVEIRLTLLNYPLLVRNGFGFGRTGNTGLRNTTIEKELTHISLFSGIGGFDLAAEWAGFKTIVFCEKEEFCQKVLKKHWPKIPIISEIRDFDGAKWRGATLLTGGFPCHLFPLPAGKKERMTIAISGQKCCEAFPKVGQIGLLQRMLLESPIWFSPIARMIWRPKVTKHSHLIFQLALVDYQRWNGIFGLLPRAEASTWKGAARNAYRTSKKYSHASGGRIIRVLRDSPQSPIYVDPSFIEAVKGFPIGWTDIVHSETQSFRK